MQGRNSLLVSKYLLTFIVFSIAILGLSKHQVKDITIGQLYVQQCDVVNAKGDQDFNVYLPVNLRVSELAKQLCEDTLKGSIYSRVSISWQPRESLTSDLIISQQFNLMMHRAHAITGLLPNWKDFYLQSISLPSYETFWFSHNKNISVTPDYFTNKRIGLLADKKSASGYLMPMSQITQAGVTLTKEQLHLYPNREVLIDDFLREKIDLMPSTMHIQQLMEWPVEKRLLITEPNAQLSWFISNNTPQNLSTALTVAVKEYQTKLFSGLPRTTYAKPKVTTL
ncbi:hypothetical protein CWB85_12670 [Pseudoalteromonas sp. S1727]|nr:hypothetical protein [Pseudoalteromonas mariniglutinosa NCIMB 1770]TMN71162.1 hypothetical protein CWB85_12670 [Pseudoalteromonas sp. S1727]